MTTITIHDVEQRSEAWYEARRGIVTASVVGRLITPTLKVASNDVSRGVIATLAAERITGHVEEGYTSDAMLRGILDEPLARDHYSKHNAKAVECGFMTRTYPLWTLGYSPDGLVGDKGLIEIKSAEPKIHLNRMTGAPIEHNHMAQMQAGMLVAGRMWCDYVSWCGGMPMWVQRVKADSAWFGAIYEAVETAEVAITQLVNDYNAAAAGLPPTTRINHFAEIEV